MAITQGELGEEVARSSELMVAVRVGNEPRPDVQDQRKLVPAANSGRVEDLLLQVIEENRQLRVRLDQMETQSSWHSGGTREGMEQSPMSFGPRGPPELVGVQAFPKGMLQGIPGPASMMPMQFHGGIDSSVTGGPAPAAGFGVWGGLLEDGSGHGLGYGRPDFQGSVRAGVPAPPPTPGLNASASTAVRVDGGPRLNSQRGTAGLGTSGTGLGVGDGVFPQGSGHCGVAGGAFTLEGYPISSDGMVIRPPPGPPPWEQRVSVLMRDRNSRQSMFSSYPSLYRLIYPLLR